MIELLQIPTRQDNYAYLVVHGQRAFVVDASDAEPILAYLEGRPGVRLEAVVNTHHHGDHVGGNLELVAHTGCAVIGAACDARRIPGLTRAVAFDEELGVAGVTLRVLDVRAHTRGHIAYRTEQEFGRVVRWGHGGTPAAAEALSGRAALFVGDSLFGAGCGRLMEGTPADLAHAMQTLASQPPSCLVCCAHEYTAANLRFAESVFPHHEAISRRRRELPAERRDTGSSVPSTLAHELQTNPFLLALSKATWPELVPRLGLELTSDTQLPEVLGALRAAKDRYRG